MSTASYISAAASSEAVHRRPFQAVRDMFKEAHPFERPAVTLQPHPVAWAKYGKHFGRAAGLYFPAVIGFFGWPIAMMYTINAYNGVYAAPKTRSRRS